MNRVHKCHNTTHARGQPVPPLSLQSAGPDYKPSPHFSKNLTFCDECKTSIHYKDHLMHSASFHPPIVAVHFVDRWFSQFIEHDPKDGLIICPHCKAKICLEVMAKRHAMHDCPRIGKPVRGDHKPPIFFIEVPQALHSQHQPLPLLRRLLIVQTLMALLLLGHLMCMRQALLQVHLVSGSRALLQVHPVSGSQVWREREAIREAARLKLSVCYVSEINNKEDCYPPVLCTCKGDANQIVRDSSMSFINAWHLSSSDDMPAREVPEGLDELVELMVEYPCQEGDPSAETFMTFKGAVLKLLDHLSSDATSEAKRNFYLKLTNMVDEVPIKRARWIADVLVASLNAEYVNKLDFLSVTEMKERLKCTAVLCQAEVNFGRTQDGCERMEEAQTYTNWQHRAGHYSHYLEWLTAITWPASTTANQNSTSLEALQDQIFLMKAWQQLDVDHFGLEKIKKRLIEYLTIGGPAALLKVLDLGQNHTFHIRSLYQRPDWLESSAVRLHLEHARYNSTATTGQMRGSTLIRFLLLKQLKVNGLTPYHLMLTDTALIHIATHYMREADVPSLEQAISAVVHCKAVEWAKYCDSLGVDLDDAIIPDSALEGMVIKSRVRGYKKIVKEDELEKILSIARWDEEERVREERLKKDGPSAGIAMTCTFISLLTGACVPSNITMTGEVTLRGHIGPVGGIKEKVLSTHRA
ncbi:uncharacterized protein LAESUDRAFT_715292 [Laetiporus sulphureus 93-53]|uniref:Lon proteolytic domain-containing protein n=1 Tax=Laetiporus sulphureus 93-53 TaxID=1314785 RepID=A0A165DEK4_9APHY|nr:uncharacterized protein LAESUDRAFT_715292 [Laetiporus sulphureus 93-53]KZT04712.1 hypothetical protein LAESUDRAFT_715292 [Laetiporus sulphureus 93-53]